MHGKTKNGRNTSNLRKKWKIKMTSRYTEDFRQLQKQATKVYEVIFFDM